MRYSLGVDLGTTFVAAAISHPSQVDMFTLGDRSVVAPTVVFLGDDGAVVTGEAADRRAVSSPERVCRGFKRRMGDPTPVMLGGAPHAVTYLLGTLLRDVVRMVTEVEGGRPERVVLTHPENWGPFRRGLFKEVPQLAGLGDTRTITEPEAVAAYYAASRPLHDGEMVAVYDLGGGTFDASILRKRSDRMEILGTPEGIERLGGVDFDEAVLSHVNHTSGGALNELDMRDPQIIMALARLRQDCVRAKEALSVDTETVLPVFLPGRHFDVRITRSDFENMVRTPIESTIGALTQSLRSAQVSPTELSAVLLVGGSSRIPLVAQMVSEVLGRTTVVDTHPKYAVALGAATLAGLPASHGRHNGHVAGGGTTKKAWAQPAGTLLAPRPQPPVAPSPPASSPPPAAPPPGGASPAAAPSSGPPAAGPTQVAPADPNPTNADSFGEGDWPTTTSWRMLVTGVALLALAVVVTLIAFTVISRLRGAGG